MVLNFDVMTNEIRTQSLQKVKTFKNPVNKIKGFPDRCPPRGWDFH